MKDLKYIEIRQKYIDFFKKHGHEEIPSSSLVPENDPTVLYVNSGMFPLVPFLKGETHPKGTRIANSQRCLRTIDIDEVGDSTHLTVFEMLGNWSLNDYFKEEAIRLTLHFFTEELGLDIKDIYASVFEGNENAPKDIESIEAWKKIYKEYGVDAKVGVGERITELSAKENWWELAGGGPCGPDSEFFYDTGIEKCSDECGPSCDCGKFVEIGNNVFMQYLKEGDQYSDLGRHNVDFGGGLDRLAMLSQQVDSVYETDIFKPVIDKVRELGETENPQSERIITDHTKAATWIIMDGVIPGRTEREYILRRLLRRSVRHGRHLGIEGNFLGEVAEVAIDQFKVIWPQLDEQRDEIIAVIEEEESKFNNTIEKGLREFDKRFEKEIDDQVREGKQEFTNDDGFTFMMYETYGFPLEMSIEELENRGVRYSDEKVRGNHQEAFKVHQDKSRSASKGMFKGGLADTSEESTKLHTATHLLLRALYQVAGDHIYQKGSNITPERLRLDFPNEQKLTPEQISEVEDIVNTQIERSLPVTYIEMPKEEALELVPYASFAERYGDIVKVYYIGEKEDPFSVEICNGPHVENTSEIGKFKIIKQENVGAGVKRIKATI